MIPGEVRDKLASIQEQLREVETTVEEQKSSSVTYLNIRHELTEGWDALERAIEFLDEMAMGIT